LELFGFHFRSFCLVQASKLALRDHEAVGRFLDASQVRADHTSFEGGNKSGALA
jgi:hypothetical protein